MNEMKTKVADGAKVISEGEVSQRDRHRFAKRA